MSIGEVLREARTEAGLSVEDLSKATKIRGQLIRDIESDNYAGCGGAIYARGHVRAIATQLRLDPVPLIEQFDREQGSETAGPAAREIFEHEVISMPERSGPNWTAAMAVAAAVMFIVALVSVFNSESQQPTDPVANAPSPSASPSPAASVAGPRPTPSDKIAGVITTRGVVVQIRVVNNRSWIAAVVDGRSVYGRTLSAPDQVEFRGDRLVHLTLGNAGAVQLIVNGRNLGTPGRLGEVLRLDFGPGDPATTSAG